MIVGIDLGTTNSLIGAYTKEGAQLFPNALGEMMTPSVVALSDDGTILVGQAARERLISHPRHAVAAFKRWMGSERVTTLGQHNFRPEELSALVLRSLIADAEAASGEKVEEAVISVPAYFSDAQRKATRAAGELAGIRVERLINEPTAAALAYGLQEQKDGCRFLILDLGGGTFDVSILELFEGVVEVHASAGDNFLGGDDFLNVLLTAFCNDQQVDPQRLSPSERAVLTKRMEQLKLGLTQNDSTTIQVDLSGQKYQWQITEERFSKLCDPLIQRMRMPIERAIRDVSLKSSQLDEIVLVGGASRIPLVSRMVTRMFGRLPMRHINPDQTIALGAAVAAGLKGRDIRLEEVILTDVCPYTLGIDIAKRDERTNALIDGLFLPIIPRNCVVPVSREQVIFPIYDHQTAIEVNVYQGENPLIEKNIKLGALNVAMPTVMKNRSANVRFTYDINGLLQVEVTVEATGERKELILEQNPGILSPEEIRTRLTALMALKVHPRDQQQNIVVLARLERLYEELLEHRELLQSWIVSFKNILESQDELFIAPRRQELLEMLDSFEREIL
ncbi:MAG: molecular chaperone HscC [Betaproteobacteria bacterium]|nr:molecular chaperone HscC [Betaproteobacteria bacterium]